MSSEIATKRERAKNIIRVFKFMSNSDQLWSSWVEGKGRYSFGYSEEMCVLYDDLLFENAFLKESKNFGFSYDLLAELKSVNESLNSFDGSNMSSEELLKSPEWKKCMEKMAKAAELLETEIEKVPDIPIND